VSRGHDKERQVRRVLEREDWWTCRAAGSLGDADVVASRPRKTHGADVRLIEVKGNAGSPFMNFRPSDRVRLADAAAIAGGIPVLAHWPPRGKLRFYFQDEWP
jgi:Holliday junction resolvase